ncbi:hypothetical protein DMA12_35750 [Amycolatopsis balhimycina DSM 5908]|uniref:Uncharacterized protein n=1 Tax=Amycolatopsis balhimycina DSM 5908 TaxID=1081091 RepID=A0A428W3T0_AMYBA|nr:hypothetical protein [Amycolatopsis balhimycina]RSM37693.1 hypothetical protein DMA12_35750 [Amycolatopsis balhimycina DSM 5908]
MAGADADEDRWHFRVRLAGLLDGLALLLEVAASADCLEDGNGLAAKAARLAAIGIRMTAKLVRR